MKKQARFAAAAAAAAAPEARKKSSGRVRPWDVGVAAAVLSCMIFPAVFVGVVLRTGGAGAATPWATAGVNLRLLIFSPETAAAERPTVQETVSVSTLKPVASGTSSADLEEEEDKQEEASESITPGQPTSCAQGPATETNTSDGEASKGGVMGSSLLISPVELLQEKEDEGDSVRKTDSPPPTPPPPIRRAGDSIRKTDASPPTPPPSIRRATDSVRKTEALLPTPSPSIQRAGDSVQEGEVACDFSGERSDTCYARGDVRIDRRSSTIIVSSSSSDQNDEQLNTTTTWKVRPYARKWEPNVMANTKELSLERRRPSEAPRCDASHDTPAVVFSAGVFQGNVFHDFTDVLVPLFATSRRYGGEVRLLVTDSKRGWIERYRPILSRLSRYEIINMDDATEESGGVRCFPELHLGLLSHKVMGIDPSRTPEGYSIADFREFLRECFSLPRRSVGRGRRPRLLLVLRKGSRSLTNEKEVSPMVRRLGYKVVTARPETMRRNMTEFARVVNSCDAMMGVHGAGLTNMLFLPENATLVQIVPWGGLRWACWHDYGEPAPAMGIRYLEYEISEDESSLIEQYPRDHAVFRDPMSIHRQGWGAIWSTFLRDQMVRLDVRRFSRLMSEDLRVSSDRTRFSSSS